MTLPSSVAFGLICGCCCIGRDYKNYILFNIVTMTENHIDEH